MADLAAASPDRAVRSPAPARWLPRVSGGQFRAIWASFDLAIVGTTGILSSWLHFGTLDLTGPRALAIVLAVVIAWLAFTHVRLHELAVAARPLTQLRRATTAVLMTVLIVATIGYATDTASEIPRSWTALWLIWSVLAFIATRTLVTTVYTRLEQAGVLARRFAVFATSDNLARLETLMARWQAFMPASDTIDAVFLDDPGPALRRRFAWQPLIAGSFDRFVAWSGRESIDQAVVLMPPEDRDRIEPVLERLGAVAVDVDLIVGEVDRAWARSRVTKVAGLPSIRVMTRPLDAPQRVVKRLEDLVIAGVSLVALLPVMVLIALVIRLDSPGPVVFRQRRHGFNNRQFVVYKFRTMRHSGTPPSTVEQAKRDDPRVTKVGAILRRTSLDELPQLINVLRGEMSIVGPRPHAIEHNHHFARRIRSYLGRHRVRPGITGWAQVNGFRGETETIEKMQKRVEFDLYYVDNWSLAFDLKIILSTLRCLIHPNAY